MEKYEIMKLLGIKVWHETGYTGKGIKVVGGELTTDNFRSIHTDRLKDILRPVGFGRGKNAEHGTDMFVHLLTVVPNATCISYPMSGKTESGEYKSPCLEYIKDNDVDFYVTALVSRQELNEEKEYAIQKCIDKGCIFFSSAGNYDEEGLAGEAKSDKYFAIGGVEQINGEWQKLNISSVGPELDFVGVAKLLGVNGTSPIAYVFTGMCALVQQFFIEKVGRKLTRAEMERFIKDNCKDVLVEGFDNESGQGLFILPEPNTIDVNRYISDVKQGVGSMFNQNNYPNIPYPSQELANATVKSGGCGLCCSANVLQHFGMNVDIKSLAEYFCDAGIRVNGGTDMQKASEYIRALVKCEVIKTNSEEDLKKYLNKGAIAIANVDGVNDIFSTEGHFINVIGVNGDMFTIFDVGYYHGKFDSEYRRKYVTVGKENGNIVQYCSADTLSLDTANRNPNYYIFYRKEKVDMEEPSDWAREAWEWGIKNGVCDGTNPKGTITREQVVQMLYNLFAKGGK